jgi:hypothetical protein
MDQVKIMNLLFEQLNRYAKREHHEHVLININHLEQLKSPYYNLVVDNNQDDVVILNDDEHFVHQYMQYLVLLFHHQQGYEMLLFFQHPNEIF